MGYKPQGYTSALFPNMMPVLALPKMLVWILLLRQFSGAHTQRGYIHISAGVSARWTLLSWHLSHSPHTRFSSKGEAHFISPEVFEGIDKVSLLESQVSQVPTLNIMFTVSPILASAVWTNVFLKGINLIICPCILIYLSICLLPIPLYWK